MHVQHKTTIHAQCPENDGWDYYEVVVETSKIIPVESITSAFDEVRGQKMYQEELTDRLALGVSQCIADRVDVKITTRGTHGPHATEVTCVEIPE
jgi:hypothetical protein